jgi:hypothetical protein
MLVRPVVVLLPIVLVGYCVVGGKGKFSLRLADAAILAIAVGVTILPWEVRLYQVTGKLLPLSSGGIESIVDGMTYALPHPARPRVAVPGDVAELMADLEVEYQNGRIAQMGQLVRWCQAQLDTRPSALLKLFGLKVARGWYGTDSHRHELVMFLMQLPYLALAALGVFQAWRAGGLWRQIAVLCLLMVAYFWLLTTVVLSIARYMVPAMPLFIILASPALANVITRLMKIGRSPSEHQLGVANS